jgi:catechol 2,3-dioxygenase-like lactoylglutathione lyase family enzyme
MDVDECTMGCIRVQMQQEAFPGEDISDRPPPEESVPGLLALLTGDYPSGRYQARALEAAGPARGQPEPGVRELRVALTVDDLDQSAALYRDGLGLPVVNEWTAPEGRGLVLAAGRATLELLDAGQAALVDRIEADRRVAGPVRLAFEVADVPASAAALQQRGAQSLHEPVQTPWGDHNQRLRAPDGTQMTLFTPGPE